MKYGATRQACLANEYLARVHLSLGQIDKAREHATACLEISQAGKMDIRTSLALIKLSEISMLEGQRDKALEFADAAINCVEAPRLRPWAIAAKARVLTDRDRAANMLRQAEELLSSMNSASHHHFHVRVIQMEVGLRQQDWLAVRQAADRLDNYTRHERLPWTDFHIDRGRVLAQWGRGALDESYKNLLAALRQSRSETGQKVWLPGDATTP